MKAPFQNLIDKLKPVVSEMDELEFQDMSELEAFWHFRLKKIPNPMYRL